MEERLAFLKGGRGLFAIMLRSLLLGFLLSMMLLPQLSSSVLAQTNGAQVQPPTQERIITYQAQIQRAGIPVPNGLYHITASLYTDADGRTLLWRSAYAAHVQGGVANLNLGEVRNGGVPLPMEGLDGPLYLGIRIGSSKEDLGEELRPLTRLSSSLNALSVADNSITKEKLATSYVEKIIVGSDTLDAKASTLNLKAGKGITLSRDNSDRVVITALPQQGSTPNSAVYWSESGNSSLAGTAYLGTSDASPLPIKVNGARVMQYSPNATSPIILGGHSANTTTSVGAVIAGGGNATSPNDAQGGYGAISGGLGNTTGNYAVVSGGENNEATSDWSVVGGGQNNVTTGDEYTTIGGGEGNDISGAGSQASTIAGGLDNEITGGHSAIGGGHANTISGDYSVIPGGRLLELGDNSFGFNAYTVPIDHSATPNIAYFGDVDVWLRSSNTNVSKIPNQFRFYEAPQWGTSYTSFQAPQALAANVEYVLPTTQGAANSVLTNNGSGSLSWASLGATAWSLTGNSGTLAGINYLGTQDNQPFEVHVHESGTTTEGRHRVMRYEPQDTSANIIGGYNGNTRTSGVEGATIAGGGRQGYEHQVTANFGSIGGGEENSAGWRAVVAGGSSNTASGALSFVGGGISAEANAAGAVVVGGSNTLASGEWSFVGGGDNNEARFERSTVGGGDNNYANAEFATIAGGHHNIASGRLSFVGGGGINAHYAPHGDSSNAASGDYSIVVGGSDNHAEGNWSFIGGGGDDPSDANRNGNHAKGFYSTIIGGASNTAKAWGSNILGGQGNLTDNTGSNNSTFAATVGGVGLITTVHSQVVTGWYNKDVTPLNSPFTKSKDRLLIIGNGGSNSDRSNAFEVSSNGHSIVYHNNGTGGATATGGTAVPDVTKGAIKGATYSDNIIYGWGNVAPSALGPNFVTVSADFGVSEVTKLGIGRYRVELNPVDPYTGLTTNLVSGSAVATIVNEQTLTPVCRFISTTPLGNPATNQFVVIITDKDCAFVDHAFTFHVTARP